MVESPLVQTTAERREHLASSSRRALDARREFATMVWSMDTPHISTATLSTATEDAVLLPSVIVSVAPADGGPVEALLGLAPLIVGTSPECDVVLSDPRVSRQHCELRITRRGISLRDLGSKNGTFLGEVPIVEIILPLGVPVRIGNSRLTARGGGAPSTVALSPAERFGEAVGRSIPMRALFA